MVTDLINIDNMSHHLAPARPSPLFLHYSSIKQTFSRQNNINIYLLRTGPYDTDCPTYSPAIKLLTRDPCLECRQLKSFIADKLAGLAVLDAESIRLCVQLSVYVYQAHAARTVIHFW